MRKNNPEGNAHTYEELQMMQALPLNMKIALTQDRIRGWVKEWGADRCCVSYSGGKDSTVLLHLVRDMYPEIPAVFANTGLEYPENQALVKSYDNVDIVTPRMNFKQVLTKYGYPVISKEVSEAVMYARKFLDSVAHGGGYQYKYCYERLTGTGRYSTVKPCELGEYSSKICKVDGSAQQRQLYNSGRWL